MRDDFAVFILTHGRPDKQLTFNTLLESGYTGKVYFVVDNQDETIEAYRENYGDMVIMFNKDAEYEETDTYTNQKIMLGVVYARNVCFKLAKEMGLKYFVNCDDDIQKLSYKMPFDKKLITKPVKNLDRCLEAFIDFMEGSRVECMSLSEDGIYMGGVNKMVEAMRNWSFTHFFLMKADSDLRFRSLWVEDIIFSIEKQRMGKKVLSTTMVSMRMPTREAIRNQKGGMRDAYNQSNEYVVAYMPIVTSPDCSKVHMKDGHIKHTKKNDAFMVKILSDRWKKVRESA